MRIVSFSESDATLQASPEKQPANRSDEVWSPSGDGDAYFFHPDFDRAELHSTLVSPTPVADERPRLGPSNELPAYFRHLYRVPLLTREQEQHAFRMLNYLKHLQAGRGLPDVYAEMGIDHPLPSEALADRIVDVRNRIVEANLRLVVAIARRIIRSTTIEFDELVSVGNAVLIRSVDLFDFRRGFRFNTYAHRAIERALRARIRGSANSRIIDNADGEDAIESVSGDAATDMHSLRRAVEARQVVASLLEGLSHRERLIIESRFGIDGDNDGMTFRMIARRIGVSSQRTAQLYHRSLQQMRESLETNSAATEEHGVSPAGRTKSIPLSTSA